MPSLYSCRERKINVKFLPERVALLAHSSQKPVSIGLVTTNIFFKMYFFFNSVYRDITGKYLKVLKSGGMESCSSSLQIYCLTYHHSHFKIPCIESKVRKGKPIYKGLFFDMSFILLTKLPW